MLNSGRLLGDYHILAKIGHGGMGAVVYRAQHRVQGHTVALKVQLLSSAVDPEILRRFQGEGSALVHLRHPHIVQVHEVGQIQGMAYIAMAYVEGGSLADRLQSGQPLGPQQSIQWISQIASALDHAHERGIIHRDIKPANVLLSPDSESGGPENAVLTDFGIARGMGPSLTAPGEMLGTPSYMSPEQVQGHAVDRRSDVYALGVLAYEMLSGRVPFSGEPLAVLHAQLYSTPPPIRRLNPRLPEELERVLSKALSKRPGQRYATAGQFADALGTCLLGRRMGMPTARGVDRAPAWSAATKRKFGYGAVGAAVLVVGLLIAGLLAGGNPDPSSTPPPAPSLPPPSGYLAYIRATDSNADRYINELDPSQLFLLDIGSGSQQALTQSEAYQRAPAWSPDGSKLAFASGRDGDLEVYLVDADGGDPFPLTDNPAWDSGPDWSPADPAKIAFDSERDGDSEVYLMDEGGGQVVQLTHNTVVDGDPAWSPDGQRLAFSSNREGDFDIYVSDLNGQIRRVTATGADDLYPAWSPDGSTIAFSRGVLYRYRFDIYVMNADGSEQRELLSSPTEDHWPSWSPDGQWIAFSRRRSAFSVWDLYAVHVESGELVPLLTDGAAHMDPAWRP
jgi:serine/threonine protein kinase